MTLEGKLPEGKYTVIARQKEVKDFEIMNQAHLFCQLEIPVMDKYTQVIIKRNRNETSISRN